MPGHFPTPYTDELFYSLCARYGNRVSYSASKSLLVDLFNSSTASAVIDLPNRLNSFTRLLPKGSLLTADRLINQHTLLPFFSAFLTHERVEQIRTDMRSSSGPAPQMRSGVMASSVPVADCLRFCPRCWEENESELGERYWNRLHQLSGVIVCPIHEVFLEDSSVRTRAGRNRLQVFAADEVGRRSVKVRTIQRRNPSHTIFLEIAHNAQWLLDNPLAGESLRTLQRRYLQLLLEHGFATYTGSIHAQKLIAAFTRHYSRDFLMLLHCELKGRDVEKSNWLLRLVREPKHTQHPLRHLLLMRFLECSAKDFFVLPEDLDLFGKAPWPCLNPAADHFNQLVIPNFSLGPRLRYGRPTGRFCCDCGFVYIRSGPDSSPKDTSRIGRIIAFGPTWDAKLSDLWMTSRLSLSAIARELKVNPLTLKRHAARLRLPFSINGVRRETLPIFARLKNRDSNREKRLKRDSCRSKWLREMKRNRRSSMLSSTKGSSKSLWLAYSKRSRLARQE